MSNLIGQTILFQFRVDEFIASGSMGAVYKVWDLKRNVPLAMKVLHADFADDPTSFKYFQREARALQKLRHPNVVPFYGLQQSEQGAFILEYFIDGPSLREVLRTHPKGMPIPEALTYMQALCAALGYAHASGVIHCDIKPGNVMVDRGGQIYLADFGIARHTESTTTTIAGAGTPAYMAPEQVSAKSVSPQTDVYALGVLLFELLTGQRPFRGDEQASVGKGDTSGERVRYAHLHLAPPDPSSLNPSIPPAAAAIVMRCMAKKPAERYSSTSELLMELQELGIPYSERAQIIPVYFHEGASQTFMPRSPQTQHTPQVTPVPPQNNTNSNMLLAAGAAFIVIVLCVVTLIGLAIFRPSPAAQPTPVDDSQTVEHAVNTPISTVAANIKSLPSVTPELIATEEKFAINEKDGVQLVHIAEGSFIYGVNSNDPYFMGAEIPEHEIYLDAYSIYRTEVTNGMYEMCVLEGSCSRPEQTMSRTISNYYGNSKYANYPVIYVSWGSAQSYCDWAGGRLPTEAEWEKAARGEDGRRFPWGNDEPVDGQVNMCDSSCADTEYQIESYWDDYMDVAPVGAHPTGKSPYDVLDMSGNVLEWVSDWSVPAYLSTDDNPTGPSSGSRRVLRGGSWRNNFQEVRTMVRISLNPEKALDTLGFRCVIP